MKSIMRAFSDNIDGSFIEERQTCILWNYKNSEAEHGTMFIHDLYQMLSKVLEGTNTEINHGSGYLEVKPKGIRKVSINKLFE